MTIDVMHMYTICLFCMCAMYAFMEFIFINCVNSMCHNNLSAIRKILYCFTFIGENKYIMILIYFCFLI